LPLEEVVADPRPLLVPVPNPVADLLLLVPAPRPELVELLLPGAPVPVPLLSVIMTNCAWPVAGSMTISWTCPTSWPVWLRRLWCMSLLSRTGLPICEPAPKELVLDEPRPDELVPKAPEEL